jgi:hypothetical protein
LKESSLRIKWLNFEIFDHKNEDTPIRRSHQESLKLPQAQKLEEQNMGSENQAPVPRPHLRQCHIIYARLESTKKKKKQSEIRRSRSPHNVQTAARNRNVSLCPSLVPVGPLNHLNHSSFGAWEWKNFSILAKLSQHHLEMSTRCKVEDCYSAHIQLGVRLLRMMRK